MSESTSLNCVAAVCPNNKNFKITKFKNLHKPTKLPHQHNMLLSVFKYNHAAVCILSAAGIQVSASLYVTQSYLVL